MSLRRPSCIEAWLYGALAGALLTDGPASLPAEALGPLALLAQYGEDQDPEGPSEEENEEEGAGRGGQQEPGAEAPPADDATAIMIKLVEFIQVGRAVGWWAAPPFSGLPPACSPGATPWSLDERSADVVGKKGRAKTSSSWLWVS